MRYPYWTHWTHWTHWNHLTSWNHITSHQSHHITFASHHIISQHITSHHIISHDIASYHITSHDITSHQITENLKKVNQTPTHNFKSRDASASKKPCNPKKKVLEELKLGCELYRSTHANVL